MHELLLYYHLWLVKYKVFEGLIKEFEEEIKDEFSFTDPNLVVTVKPIDAFETVLEEDFQAYLLRAIYAAD